MSDKQEAQEQIAIRLAGSILKRLDKLAERMSQPGMRVTRVQALRIAACRGLDEFEAERKKR